MKRYCQDLCGRLATFTTKHHHGRAHSDPAHDLCRRCWHKRMEAINAAERQREFRQTSRCAA